jgi:hypothetical protein
MRKKISQLYDIVSYMAIVRGIMSGKGKSGVLSQMKNLHL